MHKICRKFIGQGNDSEEGKKIALEGQGGRIIWCFV